MPNKKYFLNKEKSETIELYWKGAYKEVTVAFNGQPVATLNREDVSAGKSIELPNGKTFEIKLTGGLFAALTTKIDGRHIPNSQGDPVYQLKQIFYLLIFLGALNVIIGLVFSVKDVKIDAFEGVGYLNVVIGLVYIGLGYGVSKGSMPAMILIAVLMAADLIFAAMYSTQTGSSSGIIIKVLFVVFIMRGFRYIKDYKALKSEF